MYQVPNQSGKNIVITGANSGLGKEAASKLAQAGGSVIVAVRNTIKGDDAVAEITRQYPHAQLEVLQLDLSDLESVKSFSDKLLERGTPIDILINNAGVMAPPTRHNTKDGFELQFGTNFLGHLALTVHLLPLIAHHKNSRVITLSSFAARFGKIDFKDLQWNKRHYIPFAAYAQSKLADALLAIELDRLARERKWELTSVAAHPGFSRTNLTNAGAQLDGSKKLWGRMTDLTYLLYSQGVVPGTEPILFAATDPSVKGGEYYGPDGFLQIKGNPKKVPFPHTARKPYLAKKLWDTSLELLRISDAELL